MIEKYALSDKVRLIAENVAQHKKNIDEHLLPHVQYCRERNQQAAIETMQAFHDAECERLKDAEEIIKQYKIVTLNSPHKEREKLLLQEAYTYILQNLAYEREHGERL